MRDTKGMKVLFVFLMGWALLAQAGCASRGGVPQWSGSGFIRDEFSRYGAVAVLPFEGDEEGEAADAFAAAFQEKFPRMRLVGRREVLTSFRGQDFHPDRIDEAVRTKIGAALNVQALIAGSVYYPSIVRWLMQVKIIDVKTGDILGRSLVEVDFMGALGKKEAAKFAVEQLKTR